MSDLQRRIARRQRSAPRPATREQSIPAPVFGWNARDNLADMDPRFALAMDNYFPEGSEIGLRQGSIDHATGFPGPVETIHEAAFGQTRRLVGFSGGNAYDATVGGAIGAPIGTGFTNDRWIGCNAGASGGERAIYTNGVDPAQSYDGTTFASAGFPQDGVSGPLKPIGGTVNKKRFWCIENGTGQAWYGPPEAVTGPLALFDIGSVVPTGGDLVAIGGLTVDGGEGIDDITVFVMRSGAVVLYSGFDPSDASNWAIRGVWNVGNPIGAERCLVPFGNDLILISDAGFISLLRFTSRGLNIEQSRISDNIRNAVNRASLAFEQNFGWQGIYHPHQRQLLFNVPVIEGENSQQYVMNSLSSAWARFQGWNAYSWAHLYHRLFFGSNGKVVQANSGRNDSGEPIAGRWQSAWNYFGIPGRKKDFNQYRPNLRADAEISLSLGIGTDFSDPVTLAQVSTTPIPGSDWDSGEWDSATWGVGLTTTNEWRGAGDSGFNASVVYETLTNGVDVRFLSTDFVYEIGGQI